jgi:hypothetical protein
MAFLIFLPSVRALIIYIYIYMIVIIGKNYSVSERGTREGFSVANKQKQKTRLICYSLHKECQTKPTISLQMYLKFKLVQILNTPSTKRGFNEIGACGFTPTVFKLVSPNIIPLLPESFYILYVHYMHI